MRRILTIIMALLVCAASAGAEGLFDANAVCDVSALARYAGFSLDADSGEWRVHAQEIAALIDYLPKAVDELKEFGLCYISVGGNQRRGTLWLELNVLYHNNSKSINAISAAVRVGDVRYDVVLAPTGSPVAEMEAYGARLGSDGIELLQAMAGAETFSLEIVGKYAYEQEFALRDKESVQVYVNNFTVRGAQGAADIAALIGAAACGLWGDGELRKSMPNSDARLDEYLGDSGRLRVKDKGERVKAYQRLLRNAGYYAGKIDGSFGGTVQQATLNAQRFAGLSQTGCADAETLLFLLDGAAPEKAAAAQENGRRISSGGCEILLERYWIAEEFAASNAQDILAVRERSDADCMILAIEGDIVNGGAEEVYLPVIVRAEISAAGAAWPCAVLAEGDGGRALASTLDPLGRGRLLIYAELPQGALEGGYALRLTLPEGENVIELQ